MTVPTTERRAGPFVGTGAEVAYPFGFKVFAASDLLVVRTSTATGQQTELVLGSDFSVTLNPDQDAAPGGTVSHLSGGLPSALPDGFTLAIVGDLPFDQPLDLPSGGAFSPRALENALDRGAMLLQQLDERLNRALVGAVGDTGLALPSAAERADKLLSFDSDGNPIAVAPANGSAAALALELAGAASAVTGAGMVGFGYALNYAASTVGAKLRETLSVKDFGAVGDGVTDDYAAINAAILSAVAQAPCVLVFPRATYKIGTPLGYFTGSDVTIDLQGSTLDFSGVSTATLGPLLGFAGSYGATAALTSDTLATSQSVACDSSGLAAGDFVRVYSSAIWDSTRTNTRVGEINVVEAVPTGASVTLVAEAQTNYTVAQSGALQKLSMVRNVHVRNGTLIGPGANDVLIGVDIKLGLECSVEGLHTRDCDVIHIRLLDCVQSRVAFCHIVESNNTTQAYGISFTDACQDCIAIGNTMRDVRHALTTNNSVSTSYGITRRCVYQSNQVFNNVPNVGGTSGDAIDTHAGSDYMVIVGNTVVGAYGIGINVEARTALIANNVVRGSTSSGISFNPRSDTVGGAVISGNSVDWVGDNTGSNDYGIQVVTTAAEIRSLVVTGNRCEAKNAGVSVRGGATYKVRRFAVTGNVSELRDGLTGATNNAIELEQCEFGTLVGNQALGRNVGILLTTCKHVAVSGNQATINGTTGTTGFGIRAGTNCTRINVNGNTCAYTDTGITSTTGVSFDATTTYSGAWSNITEGFGTNVNTGGGTGVASANNI